MVRGEGGQGGTLTSPSVCKLYNYSHLSQWRINGVRMRRFIFSREMSLRIFFALCIHTRILVFNVENVRYEDDVQVKGGRGGGGGYISSISQGLCESERGYTCYK